MIFAGRMGESAHAYQSPSKDLKIINSRIAAHSQHPVAPPIAPPAPAPAAVCYNLLVLLPMNCKSQIHAAPNMPAVYCLLSGIPFGVHWNNLLTE